MKNLSISKKLIIGFLIVAIIAGIVGCIGLINIKKLEDTDRLLYEENTLGIVFSGDANTYYQRLRYNMAEMIILKDNSKKDDYIIKFNNFIADIDERLKNYEAGIITETDRNQFAPLKTHWEQYRSFIQKAIDFAEKGQYEPMQKVFLEDADALSSALMDEFLALYDYNSSRAEERSISNSKNAAISTWIMIAVVFCAVMIAIFLGLVISRMISKPIREMVESADKLASGNFDINIKVDSKDETGMLAQSFLNMSDVLKKIIKDLTYGLGEFAKGNFIVQSQAHDSYVGDFYPLIDSLHKMRENLTNTLLNINTAAELVAAGSDQVSSGAQALAAGSTQQASSVEELTASAEKIAEKAEENFAAITAVVKDVQQTSDEVNAGNEHMQQLSQAMADIISVSNQIANITKMIEDIAFQTNILSLNAAIEAARAGAAGKGFAVVANEVRNLAAKSAEAAKQTGTLIQSSVIAVKRGAEITNQTAQILRNVETSSNEVMVNFGKIEQSIAEQNVAIDQIKDGLSQISSVIQTNAATSEENSSSSEEMSAQAVTLREEVGKFKLTDKFDESDKHVSELSLFSASEPMSFS